VASDIKNFLRLTFVRRAAQNGTARRLRQESGASLAEIGRACNVSKGTLSRWERGLATPRGDAALRYGEVLSALSAGQVP
jgi:DNA-binding transcriptional regulator YiaG